MVPDEESAKEASNGLGARFPRRWPNKGVG